MHSIGCFANYSAVNVTKWLKVKKLGFRAVGPYCAARKLVSRPLRVIRAFKSTLEDLEERRSVHSLHSMRSSRSHPGPRPLSDITYIDEDPVKTPNTLALPKMVSPAEDPHRPLNNSEGQYKHSPKHLPDLAKMSHETSI